MALVLTVAVAVSARAQGTVDFRNRVQGLLDAPVFDVDGTTRLNGGDYVAQLFYSATPAGSYAPVMAAPAPFRTGAGAGYWHPGSSSARVLPGITVGSSVWLEVRVWNYALGTSWDAALQAGSHHGVSEVFWVQSVGGIPPLLLDLKSFGIVVPEPSSSFLVLLGLGVALRRRRRPPNTEVHRTAANCPVHGCRIRCRCRWSGGGGR